MKRSKKGDHLDGHRLRVGSIKPSIIYDTMSGNDGAEKEDEEYMKDITDPRETDVLCGRGGAALRHPGNQTYRRLVNLNKSLYITCLKTEKLKISRSIVAAIREQQGRFLERDAKKQTWYDIGDKKAIEKTSQALREGQPKLRQKMIDTGQIPPDHDSNMQHQFGNGIYNPGSRPPSFGGGSVSGHGSGVFSSDGSQLSLSSFGPASMQMPTSFTGNNMDMPPPPSRTLSNDPMRQDSFAHRLSLSSMAPQSVPSWTPSIASSMDGDSRSVRSRLRPSLQPGGSGVGEGLGFTPEATMSVMSDYSAFGMNDGFGGGGGMEMEMRNSMMANAASMSGNNFSNTGNSFGQNQAQQSQISAMGMDSPSMRTGNDRRRLFAKMKLARQPAGRTNSQKSDADGMPDIHMVDSQFSLLSNLSGHGNSRHDRNALSNLSGHGLSNMSGHGLSNLSGHGLSNLSGHDNMMMDPMGLGSRRSLMSGLSRISDHSVNSVFSDLTKKLGSTSISNRSVAMSEVSGVDEEEDDSEQDEFQYDIVPPAKSG